MSRTPFIPADALDQICTSATPPVIFDATLLLHQARFDGDFHAESGRRRWEEAHVPGSVHVEVDTELSVPDVTHDRHPPPQVLADTLAGFGVCQGTPVVVYDSTGGLWAARVWFLLHWIGIPVLVLDGGLTGWREAGLPVESGPRPKTVPVPRWRARAAYDTWIDKDELLQFGEFTGNLVCGLSPVSFSGAEPTRYSRRGHIPGSVNVPARSLFDEGGFIRSRAEVTARYRDAGADLDRELLLYCGGGISATANALALSSIGVQHARVYDGSLEEWSADPDLPLTVS
jgi:thiosulfate/3-mercaptopyruvate sulfurtransferase